MSILSLFFLFNMFIVHHCFRQFPHSSLHRRFTSTTLKIAEEAAAAVTPETSKISPDLSCLEIRIGKIVEIGVHPEAENLYVEKVDLGILQHIYYYNY